MRLVRSIGGLQAWRHRVSPPSLRIGFVPTMGALHAGHLSLIARARKQCHVVVVSIFVNPLQFGPTEDFRRYPRTFTADRTACRKLGVDVLFVPSREELYPPSFQTTVEVNRLTRSWEGSERPTHFQGVTTIVAKLLGMVRPHRVYFGQKDYQQYLVIQQLVKDLNLSVKVVRCPTVRERDGLAISSRNRFLNQEARQRATTLFQALSAGKRCIKEGERMAKTIQRVMTRLCAGHPKISVDYLAVCDSQTLEPLKWVGNSAVLLGAMRVGKVRLIDNILVRQVSGDH